MRTTGELDEDKLKRFKKFFYLRTRIIPIVTLIVFLAFKDWSIYSDVMYCILLVCAYKYIYLGYVKDITFRLELFNSGYQVVGEVVAVCEASPMEAVRISYKASDGNDYQNKNGICLPAISWQRKKVVD
jgi:hypothetical protein